jgi:hypothetical protein
MEKEIKMISIVSEVFRQTDHLKNRKSLDREQVLQNVTNLISRIRGIDESTKIAMVASASRTIDLIQERAFITEREAIQQMMRELPELVAKLEN